MKITKEARALSRQLFRLSLTDEKVDRSKVNSVVQTVITQKPRHYLGALDQYQRLIRLELAKRHVVVESATPLSSETSASVLSNLRQKYGEDLTSEFTVNPDLIGGMRIKLGSDVWDGSVRARLNSLQGKL